MCRVSESQLESNQRSRPSSGGGSRALRPSFEPGYKAGYKLLVCRISVDVRPEVAAYRVR